jgi:hypothetical protein
VVAGVPESSLASLPPRRGDKATLEDRLIARILAPWLDRELAARAKPSLSEAHAARAEQLSGDRVRRAVARSLERLLDRALVKPRSTCIVPTIPPCREQILVAAPVIRATAARLRSGAPLDPAVVARLKVLVGDRGGPCYRRSAPDALAAALRRISEPLRPA